MGRDAVCVVRDQGIGISEEDQQQLFKAFHRGSNVGTRPGTGLGLLLVKRCADTGPAGPGGDWKGLLEVLLGGDCRELRGRHDRERTRNDSRATPPTASTLAAVRSERFNRCRPEARGSAV